MNVLTFFWLYYFLNTMLMLTVIYVKKCVVKMNFEKKVLKESIKYLFFGYIFMKVGQRQTAFYKKFALFLIHTLVCIKNSTNTQIHFIRTGLEILKSSIYSGEQEKKPATRIFYSRVHSNCCCFFHEMTHTNFSKKPRQKHMSRSRQQKCEKSI